VGRRWASYLKKLDRFDPKTLAPRFHQKRRPRTGALALWYLRRPRRTFANCMASQDHKVTNGGPQVQVTMGPSPLLYGAVGYYGLSSLAFWMLTGRFSSPNQKTKKLDLLNLPQPDGTTTDTPVRRGLKKQLVRFGSVLAPGA
jgi:hypothetical protein